MSSLQVTTLRVWPDGTVTEDVATLPNAWPDWTAQDARKNRLERLRAGSAVVEMDGDALIVTTQRSEWREVQRLEWHDDEPLDLPGIEAAS